MGIGEINPGGNLLVLGEVVEENGGGGEIGGPNGGDGTIPDGGGGDGDHNGPGYPGIGCAIGMITDVDGNGIGVVHEDPKTVWGGGGKDPVINNDGTIGVPGGLAIEGEKGPKGTNRIDKGVFGKVWCTVLVVD